MPVSSETLRGRQIAFVIPTSRPRSGLSESNHLSMMSADLRDSFHDIDSSPIPRFLRDELAVHLAGKGQDDLS
jgi:hypothetical protein